MGDMRGYDGLRWDKGDYGDNGDEGDEGDEGGGDMVVGGWVGRVGEGGRKK